MAYTFITGATSGLGEAAAKLIAKERDCILLGRDLVRLKAVGDFCTQFGHNVLLFPYDLLEVEALGGTVKAFLNDHAVNVESFVHFAGMTELLPMSKTKYSVGLQVMKVNYFSACEIISTLLKRKVNGEALKNIVLVSSIAAAIGAKHQPHYCASKGAINSLVSALARDLAPQVRVNAISPGSFQTRMWDTPLLQPVSADSWNPSLLAPGQPVQVATVVNFLLSNNASYITGANIHVDGGEHLRF